RRGYTGLNEVSACGLLSHTNLLGKNACCDSRIDCCAAERDGRILHSSDAQINGLTNFKAIQRRGRPVCLPRRREGSSAPGQTHRSAPTFLLHYLFENHPAVLQSAFTSSTNSHCLKLTRVSGCASLRRRGLRRGAPGLAPALQSLMGSR